MTSGPPWGRAGVQVPIADVDAVVLIGVIANIDGHLLASACPDGLFRGMRQRLAWEHLVAEDADQEQLGYALEALVQRLRKARGDYDEGSAD